MLISSKMRALFAFVVLATIAANIHGCRDVFDQNTCGTTSGCIWNNTQFSCVGMDTGEDCASYGTLCPARCHYDFTTKECRDIACGDLQETACGSSDLGCTWFPSVFRCYPDGENPACPDYNDQTNCENAGCEYDADTFYCKETGTATPCERYVEETACTAQSSCEFNSDFFVCLEMGGQVPCPRLSDFYDCMDRADCCFSSSTCSSLASGAPCDRSPPTCSEYGQDDCPSPICFADFEQSKCRDPTCAEVFSRTTCESIDGCAFAGFRCGAAGDGRPCSEYTSEAECAVDCKWDFSTTDGACRDTTCEDAFDASSCERIDGCTWASDSCTDGSGTTVTTTTAMPDTTTTFDGTCEGRQETQCPIETCTYDFASKTCRDKACIDFFEEANCVEPCEWITAGAVSACSPPDTMEDCASYQQFSCPVSRCKLDYLDNTCRDYVCEDFTMADECEAASDLNCIYDASAFYCYAEGETIPCEKVNSTTCQARTEDCLWSADDTYCADISNFTCHSLDLAQSLCQKQDGCIYVESIFQCLNETNPDPNCEGRRDPTYCPSEGTTTVAPSDCYSIADAASCRAVAGCAYCESDLSCYTTDDYCATQSTEEPVTTYAGDCSDLTSTSDCTNNCAWDYEASVCRDRTCREYYQQGACERKGCTWTDTTEVCTPPDTGEDCASYESTACPTPRCAIGYGAIDVCRDALCEDNYNEESCDAVSLDCTWYADIFRCYPTGEEIPCNAFFQQPQCTGQSHCRYVSERCVPKVINTCQDLNGLETLCNEETECDYYSDIGQCVNATAPDYQCDLVYDESFCRESTICTWSGSCQECTEANPADCKQECDDIPSDCASYNQTVCDSNPICQYDQTAGECSLAKCSSLYQSCQCLAAGCEFTEGACEYKDDGRPCSEYGADYELCLVANTRCAFSSDEDGEQSCRDALCEELTEEGSCLNYTMSNCTWLDFANACKKVGEKDPCTRFADKYVCGNSTDCYYDEGASFCLENGEAPACTDYFSAETCPTDRCTYYEDYNYCFDKDKPIPCSFVSQEYECNDQDHCTYSGALGRCLNSSQVIGCSDYYDSAACTFAGCTYDAATYSCGDCADCNVTTTLPDCEELDTCDTRYCFSNGGNCTSRPCGTIFSRIFCEAIDNCKFDPFESMCTDMAQETSCAAYPEDYCTRFNDEREEKCEYLSQFGICNTVGAAVPCSAFKNETDCTANKSCIYTGFGCVDLTTTTSTKAPFVDPCAFGQGAVLCPNAECITGNVTDTYSCGECFDGFHKKDGDDCVAITCPSKLPIGEGARYNLLSNTCFVTSLGSFCNASCETGYTQVGDGGFKCVGQGMWQGELNCTAINPCDSSPCYGNCTYDGPGQHTCDACPTGYKESIVGGIQNCTDKDECKDSLFGNLCGNKRVCMNIPGGYECGDCPAGYEPVTDEFDSDCRDINECEAEGGSPCSANSTCTNTPPGSYTCTCDRGFEADGQLCAIKSCPETLPLVENSEHSCTDFTYQSKCTVSCKEGYSGGSYETTCNGDAWGTVHLTCRKLACGEEPSSDLIPQGALVPSCKTEKTTCELQCQAGYKGVGSALVCPALTWLAGAEPFECVACDGVNEYQDEAGQTTCKPITKAECGANEYLVKAATATNDRICAAVRATCATGDYSVKEPTETSDRVCRKCSVCPEQEYAVGGCDNGLRDTVCGPCSTCADGLFPKVACFGKRDTVCDSCGYLQYPIYYSGCEDVSACRDGFQELQPPTTETNRVCSTTPSTAESTPAEGTGFVFGNLRLTGIAEDIDMLKLRVIVLEALHEVFAEFPGVRFTLFSVTRGAAGRRAATDVSVEYRVKVNEEDVERADELVDNGAVVADAFENVGRRVASNEDLAGSDFAVASSATSNSEVSAARSSDPVTSTTTGTDSKTNLIIGICVGVAVVVLAIVLIVCLVTRRSSKAGISNPLYEANFEDIYAQMARRTLETTNVAPKATRATRQSSFYSSIGIQSSEA
eukprot:m.353755 g.353755  ORF g.353755 m.353755 type:complete len:1986 (+) comp16832_c0_seq1:244-6201(+)